MVSGGRWRRNVNYGRATIRKSWRQCFHRDGRIITRISVNKYLALKKTQILGFRNFVSLRIYGPLTFHAVHMNTRHIATTRSWFGGGADLTPMIINTDDQKLFHNALKAACDKHDDTYYTRFKEWCDNYFHLAHRNEPRGVGGIFYDQLANDFDADFEFTKEVGSAFASVYPTIVEADI